MHISIIITLDFKVNFKSSLYLRLYNTIQLFEKSRMKFIHSIIVSNEYIKYKRIKQNWFIEICINVRSFNF